MPALVATIAPTPVAGILAQTPIAARLLPPRPSPWRIFRKQWRTFNPKLTAIPALLAVTTTPARLALRLTTFGLRDPQRTPPHPMRIPSRPTAPSAPVLFLSLLTQGITTKTSQALQGQEGVTTIKMIKTLFGLRRGV